MMSHHALIASKFETEITPALPWLSGAFAILLFVAMSRRLMHGVGFAELWRTRFYEVRPVRGLITVAYLAFWSLVILIGYETLRLFIDWWEIKTSDNFWRFVGGLMITFMAWLLTRFWRSAILDCGKNPPPMVQLSDLSLQAGIAPALFQTLGLERFPNEVCPEQKRERRQRIWLLVCTVVYLAVVFVAADSKHDGEWWNTVSISPFVLLQDSVRWMPAGAGSALASAFGLAGAALLWRNGSYAFLNFKRTLLAAAACAVGVLAGLATLSLRADELAVISGLLAIGIAVRWARDLYVAHRYRKAKMVSDYVASVIRRQGVPLAEIKRREDCRLDTLNKSQLMQRISQGCRNAEVSNPLVMRNFGRFLKVVTAAHEMTTVAQMRFLTVRRSLGESCGGGTARWVQNPDVPIWDERIFPLCVPNGFVNWVDPSTLGNQWDRICWCGGCAGTGRTNCAGCGGSGRVTRYENNRTVTVSCTGCGGSGKVTCATCAGMGRLVFRRTLNTEWQRSIPSQAEPETMLPELFEDAEERIYYRRVILEDRALTNKATSAQGAGIETDLHDRLDQIGHAMAVAHQPLAESVRDLHDARYVYRVDFQVVGFWTLRIQCRWLPRCVGWFFGKRPEFYFPRLPISWSFVGTFALLPPLVISLAPYLAAILTRIVDSVMATR